MLQRLNETVIASLATPPSGNKLYRVEPGTVVGGLKSPPGLCVRVTANGSRAYVYNYWAAGQERRLTVGTIEAVNPKAAVEIAREWSQRVAAGEDPKADKLEAKATAERAKEAEAGRKTVRDACQAYLASEEAQRLASHRSIERAFINHVYPHLGDIDVMTLSNKSHGRQMGVTAWFDLIAKTAGNTAANRHRAVFKVALKWYGVRHPMARLDEVFNNGDLKEHEARDRVLSAAEMRLLWNVARYHGVFGVYVRVLPLTALRPGELLAARWDEIKGNVLHVPAERRGKNEEAIDVHLTETALELLRSIQRDGNPWLFPSREGTRVKAEARFMDKLHDDLKTPYTMVKRGEVTYKVYDWHLHDLRRTAATYMQDAGVMPHVVEKCLGHKLQGVMAVYQRSDLTEQRREALERLTAHVLTLVKAAHQAE